jgi:hypothetical protein
MIPMEQVGLEMPALQELKKEKSLLRDEILTRLRTIEKVIEENKTLDDKSSDQIQESINVFQDEWRKIKECYPEIRYGILQKIITFVGVTEENKDGAKVEPKK